MDVEPTLNEAITWLILAATAVGGFVWAVTHGQFTDLERASRLPLEDDDEPRR
jgi:cbb3-type cytochrome oxidase maturation protein